MKKLISKCQLFRAVNVPLMKGHAINRKFRWDVLGKQKLLENIINLQSLNSGMRSPYSSKATILFIFIPLIFSGENEASAGNDSVLKKEFVGSRESNYVDGSNYTYEIVAKLTGNDAELPYVNNNGNKNGVYENNEAIVGAGIRNTVFGNFFDWRNDWLSTYSKFVAAYEIFYKHTRDLANEVRQCVLRLLKLQHASLWRDKSFNSESSENGLSRGNISNSTEREVDFTGGRNTVASDNGRNKYKFWNQKWNWFNILGTRENGTGVNNSQEEYTNYTDNELHNSALDNIIFLFNVYDNILNKSRSENNITDYVQNVKDYVHNFNGENRISLNADAMNHKDENVYDRETHNIFSRVSKEGISDGAVPNGVHDSARFSQKYNTYIDLKNKILADDNNDGISENIINEKFTEATANDKYGSNSETDDQILNLLHELRLPQKGLDNKPYDLYENKKIAKREARYSGNWRPEGENDDLSRLKERDVKRGRLKYNRNINRVDIKQRDEYVAQLNKFVRDSDDTPGYSRGNYRRNSPGNDFGNLGNNNKYKESNRPEKVTDKNEEISDRERLKKNKNWDASGGGDTNHRRSEFTRGKENEGRAASDSGGTLHSNGRDESLENRSRRRRLNNEETSNYKGEAGLYRKKLNGSKPWGRVSNQSLHSKHKLNNTERSQAPSTLRDKCSLSSIKGLVWKCVSKITGFFRNLSQPDKPKIPSNETTTTS